MAREYLKDFHNKIIGSVDTDGFGNKVGRDFYGRIISKYNKKQDVTTDFYGRVVARGDSCAGMVFAEVAKNPRR